MKLSYFLLLPEKEKQTVVLHAGILIGKRKEKNFLIFLFQLNDFYVEMYCALTTKKVAEYRIFNETALLSPYLDLIEIDGLL